MPAAVAAAAKGIEKALTIDYNNIRGRILESLFGKKNARFIDIYNAHVTYFVDSNEFCSWCKC